MGRRTPFELNRTVFLAPLPVMPPQTIVWVPSYEKPKPSEVFELELHAEFCGLRLPERLLPPSPSPPSSPAVAAVLLSPQLAPHILQYAATRPLDLRSGILVSSSHSSSVGFQVPCLTCPRDHGPPFARPDQSSRLALTTRAWAMREHVVPDEAVVKMLGLSDWFSSRDTAQAAVSLLKTIVRPPVTLRDEIAKVSRVFCCLDAWSLEVYGPSPSPDPIGSSSG